MVHMKSLRAEILERLNLKQGGKKTASKNIRKATKDFANSDAPQFRGKSSQKRHQMAIAAGLSAARGESVTPKAGDKMIYEGKSVVVKLITESGMAVVRFGNNREVIVRAPDLKPIEKQQLTEGIVGLAPIGPTYRDPVDYGFVKITGLDPEDIGLRLYEDEDTGETDDQEEGSDNGSNIRHDGHTGKKEVDELPTPSDTIAPAYSDEKAPKMFSEPLSTQVGAQQSELWKTPDWDGYDYPADAPEIPTADFEGEEMGNARAPHFNSDEHQASDGQEERHDDDKDGENDDKEDDKEEVEESDGVRTRSQWDDDAYDGYRHKEEVNRRRDKLERDRQHRDHDDQVKNESFFMREMDNMLGHEDREPHKGDTITLTLPAMASIVCTIAHKVGGDHELMKSMIEALAEVGHGKTLDMDDLYAVAAHMNGEETQEIENRDAGRPDHEGIAMHGEPDHGDHQHGPADTWAGDGEKSRTGKTKLMGGVAEEADYFGSDDVVAEQAQLSDEEEFRMIKRRAGLKFWK